MRTSIVCGERLTDVADWMDGHAAGGAVIQPPLSLRSIYARQAQFGLESR
jgi:hypothetical protein